MSTKPPTLRSDWYDAETGRYMVIVRSPPGAPHRLSFLNVAMARQALNRLTRPVAGPKPAFAL